MKKYRVICGNSIAFQTDSFEEAYEKYKQCIDRCIGSDWLESQYSNTYIERLRKGSHTYIPC